MVTDGCDVDPRGFQARRRVLSALLLAALTVLPGCGSLYLLQAARGQAQIMVKRRPIDTVVADPATPANVRDILKEVDAARDFASRELGLPDNRSYRLYADLGRPYVVWNVVAAPEFSVTPRQWCFPIAGCVDYRGYFHERAARDYAAELRARNYDTVVEGVEAYSTLGHFSDPVLSTMLSYGADDLAATIFHELAHQLLYVAGDSRFNEAFAMTVENEGLKRWLTFRGRPQQMQRFERSQEQNRKFVALMRAARADLKALYAQDLPVWDKRARKQERMTRLENDIRALGRRADGSSAYDAWLKGGLNNARLVSIATYEDCVPGFQRLLEQQGGDLQRFYDAARGLAKQPARERDAQLCGA